MLNKKNYVMVDVEFCFVSDKKLFRNWKLNMVDLFKVAKADERMILIYVSTRE